MERVQESSNGRLHALQRVARCPELQPTRTCHPGLRKLKEENGSIGHQMTGQHIRRRHHVVVAAIIAELVTLSGCGHGLGTPATTSTIVPSAAPTAAAHPSQPELLVIVRGIIHGGPLPGCNVLISQNGIHYLLLDTTNPPRNILVTVAGILEPSLISYCNNGRPLRVQRITPL
jgi:hypothetical protein